MKVYFWDPEKNKFLLRTRDVCFEDIVAAIDGGKLIDVLEHPDPHTYPRQKLYIVELHEYAWVVPYTEKENEACLFLGRKYTK